MYILVEREFHGVAYNVEKIIDAQQLLGISPLTMTARSLGKKTWVRLSDQESSDSLMKQLRVWNPKTATSEEEANAWLEGN